MEGRYLRVILTNGVLSTEALWLRRQSSGIDWGTSLAPRMHSAYKGSGQRHIRVPDRLPVGGEQHVPLGAIKGRVHVTTVNFSPRMVEAVGTADFRSSSKSDALIVLDTRPLAKRVLSASISLIEPGAVGVLVLIGIPGLTQVLTPRPSRRGWKWPSRRSRHQ